MSCNLFKCQNQTKKCGWKIALNSINLQISCVVSVDVPAKYWIWLFHIQEVFLNFLVAVADANYYFMAIDVGSYGRKIDSYVFKK
jgi:hypothetical protein